MKLVKMSLVAAMVMGASAFAIDNVKVSGDAKLLYGTNDADYLVVNPRVVGEKANGLFDQGASYADTALRLGVTGDLLKGVSFGVTGYAVSSLGLENNLVNNVWSGAHSATANGSSRGVQVNDEMWIGEAWMATTMGKTTAKVGRMALDTPFVFSETWSIVANTFEAAVLINQDIPDTTLVGAWVGKGNGVNATSPVSVPNNNVSAVGIDGMGAGANFNTFNADGAYAVGAINNSWKPLTLQAWYYNVISVADAHWLQADMNCVLIPGVKWGAQYATMDPKGLVAAAKDTSAYALQAGYEGVQNLKVSIAYSDVDKGGTLKVANVATNNLVRAQSKLYTEAAWGGNFGYVSAPGAESWNVKGSYDVKGIVQLGAQFTDVNNKIAGSTKEMTEVAVTASKSFGPLDTKLAYISTDAKDQNAGSQYNTVQAYLALNF